MLDILRLVFDFAILAILCFIHTIYYPSFKFHTRENLIEWFRKGADNVYLIVLLLAPAQLVLSFLQLMDNQNGYTVVSFALIVSMWFVTLRFIIGNYRKIILANADLSSIPDRMLKINLIRIAAYMILVAWSFVIVLDKNPFQ